MEKSREHGRERVEQGTDIGMLVGELAHLGEVVVELAAEEGRPLPSEEVSLLIRAIGNGIAHSAAAYARGRDRELADQAAQSFSFIAHELRSPLHVAKLALTILQQGHPAVEQQQMLRLARSLTSLSELIDNALVEARMETEPVPRFQRLTAETVIEGALAHVAPLAWEVGLEIAQEVEPFELEADPKLMTSALSNLVSNAVKFTERGTTATIRARSEGGRAHFEVEDECGGLGREAEDLFTPWVQGEGASSGFGLGLMIVKRAVEAHGGRVRVLDHPGRGCTFALDLPLHGAEGPD
jgi:signal transduction histidine kinase